MRPLPIRKRFVPIALIALSVCAALPEAGCQKAVVPQVQQAQPAGGKMAKRKAEGGGVDDMTLVPAPAGVKTGIEGGKK